MICIVSKYEAKAVVDLEFRHGYAVACKGEDARKCVATLWCAMLLSKESGVARGVVSVRPAKWSQRPTKVTFYESHGPHSLFVLDFKR